MEQICRETRIIEVTNGELAVTYNDSILETTDITILNNLHKFHNLNKLIIRDVIIDNLVITNIKDLEIEESTIGTINLNDSLVNININTCSINNLFAELTKCINLKSIYIFWENNMGDILDLNNIISLNELSLYGSFTNIILPKNIKDLNKTDIHVYDYTLIIPYDLGINQYKPYVYITIDNTIDYIINTHNNLKVQLEIMKLDNLYIKNKPKTLILEIYSRPIKNIFSIKNIFNVLINYNYNKYKGRTFSTLKDPKLHSCMKCGKHVNKLLNIRNKEIKDNYVLFSTCC